MACALPYATLMSPIKTSALQSLLLPPWRGSASDDFSQVLASYGEKTSGELLLSYGFAPTSKENPHDAALLELEISPSDSLLHAKIQALRKYKLDSPQVDLATSCPFLSSTHTEHL